MRIKYIKNSIEPSSTGTGGHSIKAFPEIEIEIEGTIQEVHNTIERLDEKIFKPDV